MATIVIATVPSKTTEAELDYCLNGATTDDPVDSQIAVLALYAA